jgi:hypothetical protein
VGYDDEACLMNICYVASAKHSPSTSQGAAMKVCTRLLLGQGAGGVQVLQVHFLLRHPATFLPFAVMIYYILIRTCKHDISTASLRKQSGSLDSLGHFHATSQEIRDRRALVSWKDVSFTPSSRGSSARSVSSASNRSRVSRFSHLYYSSPTRSTVTIQLPARYG